MMACTFSHRKIPRPGLEGKALLRCFLGGTRNGDLLQKSDEELEILVKSELKKVLGLTARPLASRIYRWNRAMAQYAVGHQQRIVRIKEQLKNHSGLLLAGNAFDGIGIPDCIRSGIQAAGQLLKQSESSIAVSEKAVPFEKH